MEQVKPICVIYYLPEIFSTSDHVEKVNDLMEEWFPDYRTIAIPSNQSADGSCEDIRLQVFHPKDFTEIQYQELKDMVMKEIEKLTNLKKD